MSSMSFLTWSAMYVRNPRWILTYLAIYSRRTSSRIQKIAPNRPRLKRQELAVKLVSILHALYTAYGAHVSLKEFDKNSFDLFRHSKNALYYANVTTGFFIGDLILCIILIEEYGIAFVIHALAALTGSMYVSMSGNGLQYFLHVLLFEASTPFLHIRSLLIDYGYGSSYIAKINNLIFLLTFGYFRLYRGIPVLTELCYTLLTKRQLPLPATSLIVAASVSLTTLNTIWFTKILKVSRIFENFI